MNFPSELEFCSFLQYSPRGTSAISKTSKEVCHAVKTDRSLPGPFWVIKEAGERIRQTLQNYPFLKQIFGPDVVLVPIPRSSPLKDKNALWPALRICEELKKQGVALDIMKILERVTPVNKAATAARGERPTPRDHYESTRIVRQLLTPERITLVDDVITQGSTFIGLFPRLRESFPHAEINCFALVRTMSGVEVETVLAPVAGKIVFAHGLPHREP